MLSVQVQIVHIPREVVQLCGPAFSTMWIEASVNELLDDQNRCSFGSAALKGGIDLLLLTVFPLLLDRCLKCPSFTSVFKSAVDCCMV